MKMYKNVENLLMIQLRLKKKRRKKRYLVILNKNILKQQCVNIICLFTVDRFISTFIEIV